MNRRSRPLTDDQGVSVFYKTDGRGIDLLNGAYNYIDLTPKGRDEGEDIMHSWLRRRDQYDRA